MRVIRLVGVEEAAFGVRYLCNAASPGGASSMHPVSRLCLFMFRFFTIFGTYGKFLARSQL